MALEERNISLNPGSSLKHTAQHSMTTGTLGTGSQLGLADGIAIHVQQRKQHRNVCQDDLAEKRVDSEGV